MPAPVEAKVKSATAGAFIVSVVLEVLNDVVADDSLLKPLPPWLQAVIIAAAPPLVTFLSGWSAQHSPRITVPPQS